MALPTGTIDDASAELSPILPSTEITAKFGDDGSQAAGPVNGKGGCNSYFATFEVDLSTMGIRFGAVGSTEMYCLGEGIMEQESVYFETLGNVTQHLIYGDKLELRDENGDLLLLFVPLETNVGVNVKDPSSPSAVDLDESDNGISFVTNTLVEDTSSAVRSKMTVTATAILLIMSVVGIASLGIVT